MMTKRTCSITFMKRKRPSSIVIWKMKDRKLLVILLRSNRTSSVVSLAFEEDDQFHCDLEVEIQDQHYSVQKELRNSWCSC
jgi:hypothetical protein